MQLCHLFDLFDFDHEGDLVDHPLDSRSEFMHYALLMPFDPQSLDRATMADLTANVAANLSYPDLL
jgi:hypothetical protein